jgi:hypothetical protein
MTGNNVGNFQTIPSSETQLFPPVDITFIWGFYRLPSVARTKDLGVSS